uniref:Uncharacterized protein n=3 Tax=Aegilops tauschii subsp. strangulata TaxID=200361 RepID=A0A453LD31_AEGTS
MPRHAKLWIVCKLPFAFVCPMSVIFATKPIVLRAFYVRTLLGGSLLCAYKQTLLLNDSSLVFSIFIMADRIMSEKIALLKSGCSA